MVPPFGDVLEVVVRPGFSGILGLAGAGGTPEPVVV